MLQFVTPARRGWTILNLTISTTKPAMKETALSSKEGMGRTVLTDSVPPTDQITEGRMQEAGASKPSCPPCVELVSMEQMALGCSKVEGKSCDLAGFPSALWSY